MLGERVAEATTWAARARGLLGRGGLAPGEGLWIAPFRAIHSFGMRFPFDALFLDAGRRAVALYGSFPPNRVSRYHPRAAGVLELPAGTLAATETAEGDLVEFAEGGAPP